MTAHRGRCFDWNLAIVTDAAATYEKGAWLTSARSGGDSFDTITFPLGNIRGTYGRTAAGVPALHEKNLSARQLVLFPSNMVQIYKAEKQQQQCNTDIHSLLWGNVRGYPKPSARCSTEKLDDLATLLRANTYIVDLGSLTARALAFKADRAVYVVPERVTHLFSETNPGGSDLFVPVEFTFARQAAEIFLVAAKFTGIPVFRLSGVEQLLARVEDNSSLLSPALATMRDMTDEEYQDTYMPFDHELAAAQLRTSRPDEPWEHDDPTVPLGVKRRRLGTEDRLAMITNSVFTPPSAFDVSELQPGRRFWTDAIVIDTIHEMLTDQSAQRRLFFFDNRDVYIFSPHLVQQLYPPAQTERLKPHEEAARIKRIFDTRVCEYATHRDSERGPLKSTLLDKTFIFFPFNYNNHWALCFFWKPFDPLERNYMAFFMDSSFDYGHPEENTIPRAVQLTVAGCLRSFLRNVLERYGGPDRYEGPKLGIQQDRGISATLLCPQQPRKTNACGYFMCEFIRNFLTTADMRAEIIASILQADHNPLMHQRPIVFEEQFDNISVPMLVNHQASIYRKFQALMNRDDDDDDDDD